MALTKVKLIADGVIDVDHLAANHGITTDNIGEGSALYYTDARVASYLTTNSYATEGFVTTAVSNLVDAAPSTLDTLNELAAALGDDPNFATTVTNSIATKLPLAGGTLTGDIQLPAGGKIKFNDQRYFTPENNIDGAEISANGIFKVKTGVTPEERFRIDASGNIGIGVIPSSYKGVASTKVLAIGDAGNNGINVISGSTSTGSYMFSDSGGNDRGGLIYYHTADLMTFHTAGSEKIRIDSSGNVGINQSNPNDISSGATTLHITGTVTTKAGALRLDSSDASVTGYLYPDDASGFAIATSTVHDILFRTSNIERARIDSDGNLSVGVGTNPGTALLTSPGRGNITVNGSSDSIVTLGVGSTHKAWFYTTASKAYLSSVNDLTFETGSAFAMIVDASQRVGIGVAGPGAKLHVRGGNILMDENGTNFEHGYAGNGLVLSKYGVGPKNAIRSGGAGDDTNTIYINDSSNNWGNVSINGTVQAKNKLLVNRTSGDKLFMVKTGTTSSGVHFVAGFGGANFTTGYAVGIGLDPEGYDGRHKIGIAAEGNSTGWSTGKMHFLVKGGVGDSTEATLAESRMTIDNVGRVSIGTTSTDAKFHVEQGAVKHGSSHNSTFAAVKRFYQAQSAFNNPDIEIISSASATSSYPQISVHIKMHGRGLSANRSQYTEAIATITVNGSTLENLTQTTISHTGLGSTPAAGTFSVSGGSLYFTPNRQTNYDGYSLEARINSTHCTYNY